MEYYPYYPSWRTYLLSFVKPSGFILKLFKKSKVGWPGDPLRWKYQKKLREECQSLAAKQFRFRVLEDTKKYEWNNTTISSLIVQPGAKVQVSSSSQQPHWRCYSCPSLTKVHSWETVAEIVFFFRDEVPESTALNQKKLPFQEVRKKDLSVYFFPSLLSPRWVYVPQWKCPTHSNVHLLLQTADQPPTHPPARVVFCSRQFIPSPKRRKSNMCTQNEQMQYQTRVLLGGVFTIDQLLGY